MNIVKTDHFGDVEMVRLGFSPVGRPLMTVLLYVVDGLIIDTGQRHMARALSGLLQNKKLSRILLTHHHEDHSGNAAMISKRCGIPVMGHVLAAEKLKFGFPILPYQHLVWGKAPSVKIVPLPEAVETDRCVLTPVHTPGHSKDHTVFFEKRHGWLFSGDLYLGERIKFFRSDERFDLQMESLKKVMTLDFDALFCAHNPVLQNGKKKIRAKLQFLENLMGQIKMLVAKGFSRNGVIKELDPKKDRAVKWITMGNVSFANMVRSAMASIHQN